MSHHHSHSEDLQAEHIPFPVPRPDDNSFPIWRLRRRKLIPLACIALFLFLLLFFAELWEPTDVKRLEATSPSFVINPTPTTLGTSTITSADNIYNQEEPVVFSLIIWSEQSAVEGALLIKSILIYNSSPTEIHIICDDSAHKYLETRLSLVHRPSHNVRVFFYQPSWQSMLDRVEREGSIKTDHSAGLAGLMKLFIHEILPPTVKRAIYVDTDAFWISDPTLLWNVFDSLKPSTAIVMSSHPDQNTPEWSHASRICSCVMLLDLEKLRAMRLMDSSIYRNDTSGKFPPAMSPPAFRAMYGPLEDDGQSRYDNVRLGDQGYWWAIVEYRKDIFEPLSYDFEVTSCLLDTYHNGLGDDAMSELEALSMQTFTKDTPQEGIVVLPKLLHFNCLSDVYLDWSGWSDPDNNLNQHWGAAVAYHKGFKWIWLNTGSRDNDPTTLETVAVSNVSFADEKFSETE